VNRSRSLIRIRTAAMVLLFSGLISFAAGTDKQAAQTREREIEDSLIAPCCWSQPVSQHYSEVAEQIRNEVHSMVVSGKSRDEILDYYVSKYGERILASPRARGFNSLVYILPWAALILGAWVVVILLKKLRRPTPAAASQPAPLVDSKYQSVIEKEIEKLKE
jgi:cytochrome c-type biogenesis protein CcmH